MITGTDNQGLAGHQRGPALHHHPRQALPELEAAVAELGRPLLVGSSLGGYYATHLAERHGLKALMVKDRKSTRLNHSHQGMTNAVCCLP